MKLLYFLIKQQVMKIVEQLFPAQCLLCCMPSNDKLICHYCQKELIKKRSCCQQCSLPLPQTQSYCGDCLKHDNYFTQVIAIDGYHVPYPALIKRLKYNKQLLYGELLGQMLTLTLQREDNNKLINKVTHLL
ncbi:MAG: hypothetical protein GY951_06420, partial [Psychromonas sp.]|nr:hypothetical protein [Psychromonas sp.]